MTDPKPLPCPFCGAKPTVVPGQFSKSWLIGCACKANPLLAAYPKAAAIEAWNRRAPKEDA